MTPAEYDEEKTVIYAAGRPFVDRIEECIQRYRARRRMDVDRNKLFTEYLTLGGIDCSVRQFQSANKITDDMLLESSKSAIREMIADDVIIRTGDSTYCRYYNPNNPEHWDVDFTGVASAFLSDHVLRQAGNDISMVAMAADVVGNFLRYVVQHDVCPEHAEDIDNALKVCDRAVEEAVCIEDITQALPSNFCSALRFLKCIGDKDKEQMSDIFRRKDEQHAVVTVGCAALMWLPVLEKAIHRQQEWHVVDTSTHTYEVCNIRLSTDEMKSKLADLNRSLRYPKRKICAVFTARRAVVPDGWDQTGTAIPEEDKGEVEFVIEEAVVKNLKPGMKLTLVVCTTSLGWKFIKRIEDVKPSYYLFIPQELMITFKEPVFVDLSGPSIWSAQGFDINDVPIGDKDVV
ncbi:Argonaute complex, subunit Arb1 [Cladorrhinum sp. PSN332]|nr:Argonaute complex, subunit Arb1 [Cladorrhinum sp. PSN332]